MILQREVLGSGGTPTLGTLTSRDGLFTCKTLERSHDGDHPCIPQGVYHAERDWHHPSDPKRYLCPELQSVPGRSQIQMHVANRPDQLLGCIAPGERVAADGLSVEASKSAFDRLMAHIGDAFPFTLEIRDP